MDDARAKLVTSPSSSKSTRHISANYRTEEIRGYLFKKTRDGKWQKRWFETNGGFLTYYKKQGQKLLAALNLPQVGAITLLGEDSSDGPGLFTIELNERVYTIKARSHDEASFWVDALLWRQAGGTVTRRSPDVSKANAITTDEKLEAEARMSVATTVSTDTAQDQKHKSDEEEQVKSTPCAPCCVVQ